MNTIASLLTISRTNKLTGKKLYLHENMFSGISFSEYRNLGPLLWIDIWGEHTAEQIMLVKCGFAPSKFNLWLYDYNVEIQHTVEINNQCDRLTML